jgi:hypothetical protein
VLVKVNMLNLGLFQNIFWWAIISFNCLQYFCCSFLSTDVLGLEKDSWSSYPWSICCWQGKLPSYGKSAILLPVKPFVCRTYLIAEMK